MVLMAAITGIPIPRERLDNVRSDVEEWGGGGGGNVRRPSLEQMIAVSGMPVLVRCHGGAEQMC